MRDLARLDLNLLRTLAVLLDELNVTQAARRLHLSQPAVSAHLNKLREYFEDPLLLPGPRGVTPTQRAVELHAPLQQVLTQLAQVVAPEAAFQPRHSQHVWRLMASDYAESILVTPLISRLQTMAPLTRLSVSPLISAQLGVALDQGIAGQAPLDLAFHLPEDVPDHLRQQPLITERYVLVARRDHPSLQGPTLTLEAFCRLSFVVVSPNDGRFSSVVDQVLAAQGYQRQVVLSVPHFLLVPSVLNATDLVALLPERLVPSDGALLVRPAPVSLPSFTLAMVWHERLHRHPAHRWLREQIRALVNVESDKRVE